MTVGSMLSVGLQLCDFGVFLRVSFLVSLVLEFTDLDVSKM